MFYEIADCSGADFFIHTDTVFLMWETVAEAEGPPKLRKIMRRFPAENPCQYYAAEFSYPSNHPVRHDMVIRVSSGLDGPFQYDAVEHPDLNASYQVNIFIGWLPGHRGATLTDIRHATNLDEHLVRFLWKENKGLKSQINRSRLDTIAAEFRKLVTHA